MSKYCVGNTEIDFIGGKKEVGIKADEEQLKILDDVPNSAVEMIVKEKVSYNVVMERMNGK